MENLGLFCLHSVETPGAHITSLGEGLLATPSIPPAGLQDPGGAVGRPLSGDRVSLFAHPQLLSEITPEGRQRLESASPNPQGDTLRLNILNACPMKLSPLRKWYFRQDCLYLFEVCALFTLLLHHTL